jgi:hypothetical protein
MRAKFDVNQNVAILICYCMFAPARLKEKSCFPSEWQILVLEGINSVVCYPMGLPCVAALKLKHLSLLGRCLNAFQRLVMKFLVQPFGGISMAFPSQLVVIQS